MRKIIVFIMLFILFIDQVYAYEPVDNTTTADERLDVINQQINNIFGINSSEVFFEMSSSKGNINQIALMTSDLNNIQIYYGSPPVDQYNWKGKMQNRLLGYASDGGPYDNQDFPWDNGWNGVQIQAQNLVKEPWRNPKTRTKGAQNNQFNGNTILEQSILDGLNADFSGHKGKDHVPSNILNPAYAERLVYQTSSKPTEGGDWVDYVYIEQPPTYDSWGYGRVWIEYPGTPTVTYLSIRLAPFKKQINAACTITAPPTVAHDITTTTGTFDFDLSSIHPLVKYEIIDVKNATVNGTTTKAISGLSYHGSVPISVNIPGSSVTVEMTIKCTDNIGLQGFATATATITKEGPPASFDTTGTSGTLTIQSMTRGSSEFDASKGIPAGENLYVEVLANNYIAGYDSSLFSGTSTYTVTVNGNYVNASGTKTPFSQNVSVSRNYSYTQVTRYYVYEIKQAKISNYALPSGTLTLTPISSYNIAANITKGGVTSEPSNTSINVGDLPSGTSLQSFAEAQIGNIHTSSDILTINGASTVAGNPLPEPTKINPNVLYKDNLAVVKTLTNQSGTASTAIVTYQLAYDYLSTRPGTTDVTISGNKVTVHTPVICEGGIASDTSFNEELTPDNTKATIILGRSSHFRLSTSGQHRNILGYGNRDYEEYTAKKQVKFPFDVYINTTTAELTHFLIANTWYDVPLTQDDVNIFVPTWVEEGDYTVDYRAIAINAPNTTSTEKTANLDLTHYVALDSSPVHVAGRLYGFKITDVENYPLWESVFRTKAGTSTHTGTYYYSGFNDPNGNPLSMTHPYGLPLMEGSHPTVKNQALPTGYTFKYELETIGDYDGNYAAIQINPTFYYVSEEGTNKQAVDLYYSGEFFDGKTHNFVKIDNNTLNRKNAKYCTIGDPYRNVPASAIKNTARILGMAESVFKEKNAKLGYFDFMVLPDELRTFVGNTTNLPTGVNANDALKSMQHWYGEYYLPNDLFAVPKGFDVTAYAKAHYGLDGKESFWLKAGYIVVNFDIQTHKDISTHLFAQPVLSYEKVGANMWQIEGYDTTQTDSNGFDFTLDWGDIVFYNTNYKSSDDYNVNGTH